MGLRHQFVNILSSYGDGRGLVATPSQMCQATARLLGAAGAGLVMSQRLIRFPVGASDDVARTAEEIQATLGHGPCLTAETHGKAFAATEPEISEHWPVYHHELVSRTPYRSTMSFPASHQGRAFAALNVYATQHTWTLQHDLDTIQRDIVDLIGALLLLHHLGEHQTQDDDDGLVDAATGRRDQVWVAVGQLREAGGLTDTDAIALLRGHAFVNNRLIDDVALDLTEQRLRATDVLANPA